MKEATDCLRDYLADLTRVETTTVEERASLEGRKNHIDTAIKLLELCTQFGIVPGSIIKTLPATENQHFQYVVAAMNESSNPENWEEVFFNGQPFWLDGGDLLIKR